MDNTCDINRCSSRYCAWRRSAHPWISGSTTETIWVSQFCAAWYRPATYIHLFNNLVNMLFWAVTVWQHPTAQRCTRRRSRGFCNETSRRRKKEQGERWTDGLEGWWGGELLLSWLFSEEPGFLLDLIAVAGNRSQGSTRDCAHSSPLPSLDPSASPSGRLPLVTSLLLLLSLPSCHHPASVALLLLLILAVILSSSTPSICPPSFFSPYLLHLLVIPFPSPLSLFPPAETVRRDFPSILDIDAFQTLVALTYTSAALMDAPPLSFIICLFCFQRFPII